MPPRINHRSFKVNLYLCPLRLVILSQLLTHLPCHSSLHTFLSTHFPTFLLNNLHLKGEYLHI